MKNKPNWQLTLALILVALGVFFYYIHWLIFRDAQHILIYFIGDVAFVFFEVLLVTLVIHRLLHHRERKAVFNKINMLIGAFFSELGTELLRQLAKLDTRAHKINKHFFAPVDWSESQFLNIRNTALQHDSVIEPETSHFADVDGILQKNKPFLLDLLQNQNLLQNDPFTDLVWAVYHLAKELEHRGNLNDLPEKERWYLNKDIKRVYELLLVQWMDYMQHLKTCHPHLFSLADRRNPFHETSSVEVK